MQEKINLIEKNKTKGIGPYHSSIVSRSLNSYYEIFDEKNQTQGKL